MRNTNKGDVTLVKSCRNSVIPGILNPGLMLIVTYKLSYVDLLWESLVRFIAKFCSENYFLVLTCSAKRFA